jgi:CHAT domain-containing protein
LAVGNSDGIRCDNRSRNLKRFFLPLAHVREEIRALAGVFSDRKVTTLIDEEAMEARLRMADLSHYGIIHLAVHGVIDDTDWWRSALLLRPDPGSGDDGFFTVLEISKLELRASLVVLSGCGTGTGSLFKGEGIRGLSGAFLRAGAGYLLVSLWNVDDGATAELMGRFYRGLAAGASPARALADAKKRMIVAGYRNPLFWAPFILIENGDDPGQEREEMKRTARLTR